MIEVLLVPHQLISPTRRQSDRSLDEFHCPPTCSNALFFPSLTCLSASAKLLLNRSRSSLRPCKSASNRFCHTSRVSTAIPSLISSYHSNTTHLFIESVFMTGLQRQDGLFKRCSLHFQTPPRRFCIVDLPQRLPSSVVHTLLTAPQRRRSNPPYLVASNIPSTRSPTLLY